MKRRVRFLLYVACFLALACMPPRGAGAAGEAQKLTFLHYWTGPFSGGIAEMVDTFSQAQKGYSVRATGFEHESFKVGIKVMLASGNPPDLFSYWAGARTRALVEKGYLAPIDDVWKSAGLDSVFSPAVRQACVYDGSKYMVPLTQHLVGFFYNAGIFRDLGLTPPRDWPAFLRVCERLKQAGVTPIALGAREKWPAQYWFDLPLMRTAGPEYYRALTKGRAAYTDAEPREVFRLWKSLLDKGYFIDNPRHYDWSEAAMMVYSGQAAMTLMGTWVIGLFEGQLGCEAGQDYDFFPFPKIDDVPQVSEGPIDGMLIPREGHVAGAKEVIAYFAGMAPQERMSKGSGALSPNTRIPMDFYPPLQQKILRIIQQAPQWMTPYDLAVPPLEAQAGLEMFVDFLDAPHDVEALLQRLERAVRALPAESVQAGG